MTPEEIIEESRCYECVPEWVIIYLLNQILENGNLE